MSFDFTSHQAMLNTLATVLVLVVGLSLVVSIVVNRLLPHIGAALLETAMSVRFPFSKTVDLKIRESAKPKRVVLSFSKSVGFYNGKIVIKDGNREVGCCELPVRPEYTNKSLGFYNEDISRQSNVVVVRVQNHQADCPLTLVFNLNQNVHDPTLREKLQMADDEEIKIEVRG